MSVNTSVTSPVRGGWPVGSVGVGWLSFMFRVIQRRGPAASAFSTASISAREGTVVTRTCPGRS